MKFGLFTWFNPLKGKNHQESFAAGMREVELADEMGWDAVWLPEIHFGAGMILCANSILMAAGIGTRTKNLKVGTAVHQPRLALPEWAKEVPKEGELIRATLPRTVASYEYVRSATPISTAEDVATADQLTNGRFILGLGGTTKGDSHKLAMFLEFIEVMKQCWREEEFSGFKGAYYDYPQMLGITPRPVQQPGPPIFLAAESPDTFPTAGRLGYHLLIGAGTAHNHRGNEGMMEDIKVYRREWAAAGHAGEPSIVVRIPTHVRSTKQQALDEVEETVKFAARSLSHLGRQTLPQADPGTASLERVKRANLFSTPSEAIERILQMREELGATAIMFETNYYGQIDREAIIASMRMITEKVIPAIPEAEPAFVR